MRSTPAKRVYKCQSIKYEYNDKLYNLFSKLPALYADAYIDYYNRYHPDINQSKEILKLRNKSLLEFLKWCEIKFKKAYSNYHRKKLRIASLFK